MMMMQCSNNTSSNNIIISIIYYIIIIIFIIIIFYYYYNNFFLNYFIGLHLKLSNYYFWGAACSDVGKGSVTTQGHSATQLGPLTGKRGDWMFPFFFFFSFKVICLSCHVFNDTNLPWFYFILLWLKEKEKKASLVSRLPSLLTLSTGERGATKIKYNWFVVYFKMTASLYVSSFSACISVVSGEATNLYDFSLVLSSLYIVCEYLSSIHITYFQDAPLKHFINIRKDFEGFFFFLLLENIFF